MQDAAQSLKELLLSMTTERSCDRLLGRIASGLAEQPHVALARLWIVDQGDICESCPRRAECPGQVPCLHLVASAGTPREAGADWTRLDGGFRRFPIGVRKIGTAAEQGAVRIEDVTQDNRWIADVAWARREGIVGFGAVPLTSRGETLGVLGVFMRTPCDEEMLDWLRLIGDHAGSAITNARAFEEIEQLKQQLELENAYLKEQAAVASSAIIGTSPALKEMLDAVETVAPTGVNVLVTGESGVGKELVARAIHQLSDRSERTLVKVNCASVPHELFESEFFGHGG